MDALGLLLCLVGMLMAATGWALTPERKREPELEAQSPDSQVRQAAVRHLIDARGEDVVQTVLAALQDSDAEVCFMALSSAFSPQHRLSPLVDPRFVEPLITALHDPAPLVVIGAAWGLTAQRDPRAVEPLLAALQAWEAEEPWVGPRTTLIDAVASFRDPRSAPLLLSLLEDRDPAVKASAATALGALRDPRLFDALAPLLRDEEVGVRARAAAALGDIANPQAEPLLLNALEEADDLVCEAAAMALGSLPTARVIDALSRIVVDQTRDQDMRVSATISLGRSKDPRALPALVFALNDPALVRMQSVSWALATFDGPEAIAALAAVASDPSSEYRTNIVYALGHAGDPSADAVLLSLLHDRESFIRGFAAATLARRGYPRATEILLAGLRDREWRARSECAQGLGELKAPSAIGPLIAALRDRHWQVRGSAAESLAAITGKQFGEDARAWRTWWRRQQAGEGR